jgi:formimidoylglutamate deiminase
MCRPDDHRRRRTRSRHAGALRDARAGADALGNTRELTARALTRLTDEDLYDAAKQSFMEMLLAGITTVGECHFLHHSADATPLAEPGALTHAVLRAARDVGIRIALLHGVALRGGFGQPPGTGTPRTLSASVDAFTRATDLLQTYVEKNFPGDDVWLGLAPHSLGAVPLDALKVLAAYAHTNSTKNKIFYETHKTKEAELSLKSL